MKKTLLSLLSWSLLAGGIVVHAAPRPQSLASARQGFHTRLLTHQKDHDPILTPPAGFRLVHYAAPVGALPAYVTVPRDTRKRHPAIVWIEGGFDSSIGDTPWASATPDNDQSAAAFRDAGVVTMYPARRGGNGGPGYHETFYGEVDDVLAAARWLARQPEVDPKRIYLGGHSTGGTLALLVAECPNPFRAVFAFGPVAQAAQYGADDLTFDGRNEKELRLRAPVLYLGAISCPTYVFEGTAEPSNLGPLQELARANTNPRVRFFAVAGKTHFSILAPMTLVIARQAAQETGARPHFSFHYQGVQPLASGAR